MLINSVSIGFVVGPLTFISVAFNMSEFAVTARFVVLPFSVVSGAIWPSLATCAITKSILPLTFINSTSTGVRIWRLFCSLPIGATVWRRLFKFSEDEVSRGSNLFTFQEFNLLSS